MLPIYDLNNRLDPSNRIWVMTFPETLTAIGFYLLLYTYYTLPIGFLSTPIAK